MSAAVSAVAPATAAGEAVGAAPDAADPAREGRPLPRLTLRAKGALALAAVVLYVIVVGFVLAESRHRQLLMVEELERTHRVEELLVQVNMGVARAILTVNDHYGVPQPADAVQPIGIEIEAVLASLAALRTDFPMLDRNIGALQYDLAHLRETPARGDIAALRATLHELVVQLDNITMGAREKKEKLLSGYRAAQEAVTMEILVFSLLGVSVLGIVTALFFTQLAWDIRHLSARAVAVVKGYRGEPLPITRGDEVGELMQALNHMQHELRSHEIQLELSRQQTFHKEKMAAVGSLAAQLAHEINNPIAAISGVAQSISEVRSSHGCPNRGVVCQPELILEQARRVATITRQIAEFTAPQPVEAQLLDLNGLVRSTCNFVSYDRRFKNIDLAADLDGQLPAVYAIGDHLTQVLMNLLINAADAMEGVAGRKPAITVGTRLAGERVLLTVTDNGAGMTPEVAARAFDEFFTTKPAGKGSGLGLALCKNLIESSGGAIAIESTPGAGTRVGVSLPLGGDADAA